ncbi:MAG: hypothetical protein AAB434_06315 [Planctomycetota bacterium]
MRRLTLLVVAAAIVAGCGKTDPPVQPPKPPTVAPPIAGGNQVPGQGPGNPVAAGNPSAWGWIGAQLGEVPQDLAARYQLQHGGAHVKGFADGSPARGALQENDVVVRVGDQDIDGPATLLAIVRDSEPGRELAFSVHRAAGLVQISVKVGERRCKESLDKALQTGVEWLTAQQRPDGAWEYPHPSRIGESTGRPHSAVTALAVAALASLPKGGPDAKDAVARGIAFLKGRINSDGLVDAPEEEGIAYRTYATSLTLLALARRGDAADKADIERLVDALRRSQMAENVGLTPLDWLYGSWNTYDQQVVYTTRGDLSGTSFALHALYAAGVPANDPVFRRGVQFVKRAQNMRESGPGLPELDDGGFTFNPRDGKAGSKQINREVEKFYSYGSPTSDGLRGLFYCVRKKDDPRVQIGLAWFARNFTVERNPGFQREGRDPIVRFDQGLHFYYLHSLAEALHETAGDSVLVEGRPRFWAADILGKVCSLQQKDGRWQNPINVMNEDDPNVATGLCLLTLDVLAQHVR